ncbi:MBL fold metallo-hydrolase [Ferviditalea candida]|uniref:MBL fold metallo-hydrolase n=1 Tax=Ferviditalea candida TaxID=3108399 RepID=A0ABU5ZK78_9BACL|nr:MBL fold metallo-hydrolase [Paenibacillaceae bacterium T2]
MRLLQAQTVYQLTFMPRFFPVNCYFVEEEDGFTLIDAALPNSAQAILQAARQIGKPIMRIVLTHAHYDHVGALDALKQALPEAAVHISKRDARLLAGDRTLEPGEPSTRIRGGVPAQLKTRADILLQEGDRIGSLSAMAAPGHTPGSMAFLDIRNGSLIAGDAFQTRGGIAVSGQIRPWFPFPAMATWNKEKALESARKLRDISPSLLAVGHGDWLEQPGQMMDRAIADANRNLARHNNLQRS